MDDYIRFQIDAETKLRFKFYCLDNRISMTDFLIQTIKNAIEKGKDRKEE